MPSARWMPREGSPVVAAWITALASAAALGALIAAGRWIPTPPLDHPARVLPWLGDRDPAVSCFSLVRLAGLGLAAWLAAAGAASVLAAAHPRRWTAGVARALCGAGLTATFAATLTPALPAGAAPPASGPGGQATISAWPSGPAPASRPQPAPPAPARPAPTPAPGPEPPPTGRWVVEPGESFWSIAEKVVAARTGRPAALGATASYWVNLVATNRLRLRVPGHPDLIFPGQTLDLPE